MRPILIIIAVSTSILSPGCSSAQATTPDPSNPAQCIAAFEYGHEMLRQRGPVAYMAAISMTGRQLYYTQKLKAAGVADGGAAEAMAFAKAHLGDATVLHEMLVKCIDVQQQEPNVSQAIARLTPWIVKVDPICKENASICQ